MLSSGITVNRCHIISSVAWKGIHSYNMVGLVHCFAQINWSIPLVGWNLNVDHMLASVLCIHLYYDHVF